MVQAKALTLINGQQLDAIPLEDRGFAYADGLFETMRWQEGEIPLLDLHLGRLCAGCESLGLTFDHEGILAQIEQIKSLIHTAYDSREHSLRDYSSRNPVSNDNSSNDHASSTSNDFLYGKIKLTVTRGNIGYGCYPIETYGVAAKPVNIVIQFSMLETSVRQPVALVSAPYALEENSRLVGLKHLNRLNYISASQGVELTSNQEIIFCDLAGNVVETMHHNLFMVKDRQLFYLSLIHI